MTTDLYPERLSFENAGEEFDRARGVLPGHGVGKQPPAARTGIVEESAMGQNEKSSRRAYLFRITSMSGLSHP